MNRPANQPSVEKTTHGIFGIAFRKTRSSNGPHCQWLAAIGNDSTFLSMRSSSKKSFLNELLVTGLFE